jgi:hypothetical protein
MERWSVSNQAQFRHLTVAALVISSDRVAGGPELVRGSSLSQKPSISMDVRPADSMTF